MKKTAHKRIPAKPTEVERSNSTPIEPRLPVHGNALVFVSHDSRDADLAEAFSNLLTDVSAGMLKSFRASDKKGTTGIPFGAEWYRSIMSRLEESTDVVALLTHQSIERPWILYEAGVAKGKLETTVLGVALGVPLETVSAGPFGQFQNCGGDEDSLTKLVVQLLRRNPDAAPREEAVRMQVKIFCAKVGEILKARGKTVAPPEGAEEDKNVAKLFEEVKAMVRELPERVDDRVRTFSRNKFKGRRFHPKMFEELLFVGPLAGEKRSSATGLLILVSILRDELPWFYEPGLELYRAIRSGSEAAIEDAKTQLMEVLEAADHPMFFDITRGVDEDTFMLTRYLPRMIERALSKVARNSRSRVVHDKPEEGGKATDGGA
ncbi:MAG TPA: hypothetical protein VGH02_05935 [Rhizomicrobium sp.]|jgi:hypothetical protein